MEYSVLGKTNFWVSKLGLGGAPLGGDFGGTTDEEAFRVLDAALDLGINFIDTAPLYGAGESERRIGQGLKGKRDRVILATKAVVRGVPYTYDNTIKSVKESLKRLQTDYIDLIQLHELESVDYEAAMEGTVAAFLDLKREGIVRAIGVNAGKIELLLPFVRDGIVDTIQTFGRYTPMDYTAKAELLPLARAKNIGVIHGSPLGMGLLTDRPAPFLAKYPDILEEAANRKQQLEFLHRGEPNGLVEPAMRFSLTCPDIAVTLTGTTSVQSLTRNASYCDGIGLTPEDEARVLSLFPGKKLL
ncbi:aldo/keto reductase [Paenibacillus hodogayensis]|uniref:Aldo/keto reductase n=1 Tax=Paenibacillus hodogayensis TaxID=279208 RepID=A0ABV5VRM8_9BACL